MKKNRGWTWFCHHRIKLEYCTDFVGRAEFIKTCKPAKEIPARLNAFRFVKGKLPKELLKAGKVYNKAWKALEKAHCKAQEAHDAEACDKVVWEVFDKVWEVHDKAWETCTKVVATYQSQINKLFAKECSDVSWDEGNRTLIF